MQESENLLPIPAAPLEEIPPGVRRQRREHRMPLAEVGSGELRHGAEPAGEGGEEGDPMAAPEDPARHLQARQVGGAESPGAQYLHDQMSRELVEGYRTAPHLSHGAKP